MSPFSFTSSHTMCMGDESLTDEPPIHLTVKTLPQIHIRISLPVFWLFCSYGMLVMITTFCDRHLGLGDLNQMETQ